MQNQQINGNDLQLDQQRELSGYEDCLNCCGECGGTLRAWCPCICFVFPYPFWVIQQSNVGLVEKFGKYYRTIEPGLNQINPCTDTVVQVDLRTVVLDMPRQSILTRDNIQINIDTVLYYRITNPAQATYKVQNLRASISEMSISALRQVCGEHILQDLLESREMVQESIENYLDLKTAGWGIFVDEIFIKDMQLSQEMQSDMAMTAKNKRIAQAKVISAKADVESAKLMREAADFLDNKAAMQIRFLETLQFIGKEGYAKTLFLPLSAESTAGQDK